MVDSTEWRKSSYSGGSGGNCVEVGTWRASSHSGPPRGNCVEVGDQDRVVLVRDTRDRDGGGLAFGPAAWRAFTGALQ